MQTVINLVQVGASYPNTQSKVFSELSLNVKKGDFCIITGVSGSGKTSIIKLINGELKYQKGNVHVLGNEVGTLGFAALQKLKRTIVSIYQDYKLIPRRNVKDNVGYSLEIKDLKEKGARESKCSKALEQVGLTGFEQRNIDTLSGGQQQRVAIARAIVYNPICILADEITGNLDPKTSKEIVDILRGLHAQGTTIIFITHDNYLIKYLQESDTPLSFFSL